MKYLTIILISLFCIKGRAQRNIQKFDIRDGLSSNYVNGITQDKHGFLWFATEEGLSSLDGSNFRTFYVNSNRDSTKGVALNVVFSDAKEPLVWIGAQRDGLASYNVESGKLTYYRHNPKDPNSIATNDITAIAPTADSTKIWVSTFWQGVELLDKTTGSCGHFNTATVSGLPENRVWSIADDCHGHLYVGHNSKGMSIIDIGSRHAVNIKKGDGDKCLPGAGVNKIVIDDDGRVWTATNNGLAIYYPQENRLLRFDAIDDVPTPLKSGNISTLAYIDRQMWVAVELCGVYVIDTQNLLHPKIEHIGYWYRSEDLSSPSVRSIFKDRYGNIWLGTWSGGLNFISHRPSMFSTFPFDPNVSNTRSLTDKTVLGLCFDSHNRLWAAMDGGGVVMIENGQRKATLSTEQLGTSDNTFDTAYRSSDGKLWFGSYGGWVAMADENTLQFRAIKLEPQNGNTHADVRCFFEDINGNMLIGTGSGIYVIDKEGQLTRHYDTRNSGIGEDNVHSISRDSQGNYWIGTFGQGLSILSPAMKRIKNYHTDNGFCSNAINHILHVGRGIMAVATSAGLVVFDNGKATTFTKRDGLVNQQIRAIAIDSNQLLWLSTNKGLAYIDYKTRRVMNFPNNDYIGYGEFSNGAVTTDGNGNLYFGYNGGICKFNPIDITKPHPDLLLQFTSLTIYGETSVSAGGVSTKDIMIPIVNTTEVSLDYTQNTFSIGFNTRDFALESEVAYSYRLRELGAHWFDVTAGSQVTFRNLSPGSYTLEVRCRLKGGEWSKQTATLHITVAPPLWRSWWAVTIYVVLLIAIVAYNFMVYRRRMIRRHEYRMKAAKQQHEMALNQEKLQFYINAEREARDKLAEKEARDENEEKRRLAQEYLQENENSFIRQVATIISGNLSSGRLDISFIAGEMNMSTSSLYRKMKSLTGMGPNEFINKVKMKQAEEMLIQGKLSISEIAFRLGYSTPAYFRQCFKEEFGMPPSEFVKRNLTE